jgi:hypothetical protein
VTLKRVLTHELSKLFRSRSLWIAVAVGGLLALIHFAFTVAYVQWAYYSNLDFKGHPVGLDNISLLYRFLGCDDFTAVGTLFYLVLPILAAFPYGASLYHERKNGYQIQVIARVGKKRYLAAKFITAFLSGFLVIGAALVLDLMLCATVCPLSPVSILSLEMSTGQGNFAVNLFYSAPALYLLAAIGVSAVWGGVCAALSLAAEMFVHNGVIITLFPFLLLYFISCVTEYLNRSLFSTFYELRPIFLFSAQCSNRNPAWYIALWQLGALAIAAAVYFGRGMKRENF